MAAAHAARRHGLSVIVADEGASAGGQIYRQAVASPLADTSLLGADYAAGRTLIERFMACGAQYLPQTLVWHIEPAPNPVAMLTRRGAHAGTLQVHAEAVLLATGAQEGPWPVRGWTLPGVMGVGAAQATLKSAGLVPGADTVLAGSGQRAAGSGPLLWLFASQLLKAGRTIRAVVDTTPRGSWHRALRHMPRALLAADYLLKGVRMMRAVHRAGVDIYSAAQDVEIVGETHAQGLRFLVGDIRHELRASLVLLHQGVVPGTNAARSIGCVHRWDESQAWLASAGRHLGPQQCVARLDSGRLRGHWRRESRPMRGRTSGTGYCRGFATHRHHDARARESWAAHDIGAPYGGASAARCALYTRAGAASPG
jgi:hypothetical protein